MANDQLTEKQAAELLNANRLGFISQCIGAGKSAEGANDLYKKASTRLDRRTKLAQTILDSLKSDAPAK